MNVYFGRFQECVPGSVVVTSGIGRGDYTSLVYAKTSIYTAEQVLSGSVDVMLNGSKRIELSHLTRTEYRDICIHLVRLCKIKEYDFDLYVPNIPECTLILRDSKLVHNWYNPTMSVEEVTAADEYCIPDEVYEKKNMLHVDKDGNIVSSSGKRDSIFTIGFLSYGEVQDCDSPYINVVNDFEYTHDNPYFTKDYNVSLRGTINQTKVSIWDNLNRISLDELSMCFLADKKEYCVCKRADSLCKYRHRDKMYYFTSAASNVTSGNVDVIEKYQTYPINSIISLIFARVVCRNQSKINPAITLELCFDGAVLPIEVDEVKGRLVVDKFTYDYHVFESYAKELLKQDQSTSCAVTIHAQVPNRIYDMYTVTASASYGIKDTLCSKAMSVEMYPVDLVIYKSANITIADTLYVDFSDSSEEYSYAAELLEALEKLILSGEECAYKFICIKPNTNTEQAFARVL